MKIIRISIISLLMLLAVCAAAAQTPTPSPGTDQKSPEYPLIDEGLALMDKQTDRSFISRMMDSSENCEIVYTIIRLAQNLKMKVVAEGIETAEQLQQLKVMGCEYGQGYFFSKPMDAANATRFIEAPRTHQIVPTSKQITTVEESMRH